MGNCARALCSEGLAVLRFDCYGSGESEGSFEEATITSEVEDLQGVIEFVKSKGYSKIGLVGISLGTTVCILSCNDSIHALVLWSPPFSHKWAYEWYKPQFGEKEVLISTRNITGEKIKVGRGMLEEFGTVNLDTKIKSITCPVLVVYGTEDHATKIEPVKKHFEMLNCEKELFIIQGGDHDFLIKEVEEKAIKKTIEWFKNHLK